MSRTYSIDMTIRYYVVMVDYGSYLEAIVTPNGHAKTAAKAVTDAWGEGYTVPFVHLIQLGKVIDVTDIVRGLALDHTADHYGREPIRLKLHEAIASDMGIVAANAFNR